MPTLRRHQSRRHYTLSIRMLLELLSGPHGGTSSFTDEADRLAAWEAHRERLMRRDAPSLRPWAFWHYDSGRPDLAEDHPLFDRILKGAERAEREAWERRQKAEKAAYLRRNRLLTPEEDARV